MSPLRTVTSWTLRWLSRAPVLSVMASKMVPLAVCTKPDPVVANRPPMISVPEEVVSLDPSRISMVD